MTDVAEEECRRRSMSVSARLVHRSEDSPHMEVELYIDIDDVSL